MRLSLQRLLGPERGPTLDANAIDDASFLIVSGLAERGFLKPEVAIVIENGNGGKERFNFDASLTTTLPRTISAHTVEFQIKRGLWYHVVDVHLDGLHVLSESDGRAYYRGENALLSTTDARAYSPARVTRGSNNLQAELRRRGYAEAEVMNPQVLIDDKTGAVRLGVVVREGPLWRVTSLDIDNPAEPGAVVENTKRDVGMPWSPLWQQDVMTEIRNAFFARGFPDVDVQLSQTTESRPDGTTAVAVTAHIMPGPAVKMGEVRFEGAKRTHESVLRRRVQASPGDPLNPAALQQARYRLARLGVFDNVDLSYDPPDGDVRSPVFALREGRTLETNLLFGYGSYEQVRGGIELRQFNLFGSAHQSRALLLQSMKSSRGEYSYTVPELFGESVDGTAKLFGLQREERSFVRQEYGGSVLFSRPVPWIGAAGTLGYTFQALRNLDNALATSPTDNRQIVVASVDASLTRDRRDYPLHPRRGYRLFVQVESADRHLGGEVNYQRVEMGASYHTSWGSGRWIHVGLEHGFILTLGGDDSALPVNKRFYPGGDSSIRGFSEGEAAPRGADGRFVGAKTYLLGNFEIEQALTKNFSAVTFFDGLGEAARLSDYPYSEKLFSAGLGLRYQTLIGPVRLEYGRNINPRPGDPGGAWLLSVGVPF